MAAPLNTAARSAVDMFCYSAAKQIAGMRAALGSIDLLVFTGASERTTCEYAHKSAIAFR
jgi:acetate kinase